MNNKYKKEKDEINRRVYNEKNPSRIKKNW